MDWSSSIRGFKAYLQLERSLSENSITAYISDIQNFRDFIIEHQSDPTQVSEQDIETFIQSISLAGKAAGSQARMLSGIKAFYKYLLIENIISTSPTELIEGPKVQRKLPDVLSYDEITLIIDGIDLSKPEGARNKAIIETLYGCGLRVSELVELKISDLHFHEGFIRVTGKGDKQRLVPIGDSAIKYINIYKKEIRVHQRIQPGFEDMLFLNNRGKSLSRNMIFMIIKKLTEISGIQKKVSPHTFRHSFATHLIEGGANLRAVQDMLGHESITTTEIYTHVNTDFLRETLLLYHPGNRN